MKPYLQYANDVVEGNIVAGEYIRLACQRFLDDLQREDLYFDEAKVDRAIRFIQSLKHYVGRSAGKQFLLEPWQSFIVANLVGLYRIDADGNHEERKYTYSYTQMARKQGKTALSSALALYYLIADGESGAEVDFCANSKEQAKIAFGMSTVFAQQLDPKGKHLNCYRDKVKFDLTKSVINVFSSDASKLDGYCASCAIIDEFHESPNLLIHDVLQSSMGTRLNPLMLIITTAGFDKTKPCYSIRKTSIDILKGIKQDDSNFAMIFELDETDSWEDESVWIKANPNLDVTVHRKFIREQITAAKNDPSKEVGVRTKTLNQWCDSSELWIPDKYILNSINKVNLDDPMFEDQVSYVGIDLASVGDLTAISIMIPRYNEDTNDTTYYFKNHYYLPEQTLLESSNKTLYNIWRQMKQLTVTPGNVTDYDYILNDLMKLNQQMSIHKILYDKWNSTQFVIKATEEGLPMWEYSQSLGNFNKPTRELERLIRQGKVVIDNNDITRYCFSNVVLKSDWNNNVKPIKKFNQNKIDGVVAMIQALGGYLDTPQFTGSISVI
jgi:phage terminase large subunit-like protein